jgi:hypothetical protein
MLATDHPSLAAKRTTAIDLGTLAGLHTNPVPIGTYGRLLRHLSLAEVHYCPKSGKRILAPDGQENPERQSKYYLYLPHAQSQLLAKHHGYYWRVPGVDFLTGDRQLRGSWYIHHEAAIEVAVTSY